MVRRLRAQRPLDCRGPQYVPAPLLRVPVRYYHEPPGHWREWRHEEPPRWEHDYGHEWDKQREGWRGKKRDRGEHGDDDYD
jgi:hypothetical protein